MKINNEDLKELYKAYIKEKSSYSRKDCPSPKETILFSRSKSSEKKKKRIMDHIINCYYCAQEFEFILETLRYENILNQEIGKRLVSKNETNELKKATNGLLFPLLSWKFASLIAGVAIITSVILAIVIFINLEKREYRGANQAKIILIEPINKKYSKFLLTFKWSKIENSDYYILEIFDKTLYPVWESKKIFKTRVVLPDEISSKLIKNNRYFWMVTAFFSDGSKTESIIKEFKVTE